MDRATKHDKMLEMTSQKVDIALSLGWDSYVFQIRIKTMNGTHANY